MFTGQPTVPVGKGDSPACLVDNQLVRMERQAQLFLEEPARPEVMVACDVPDPAPVIDEPPQGPQVCPVIAGYGMLVFEP